MRVVVFCHSLVSDWNHGNAHFLRGVARELIDRDHEVVMYEPRDGWSRRNLVSAHGDGPVRAFAHRFPELGSREYDLERLDLDAALDHADLVLVHEWSEPELVSRIGRHHVRVGGYTLLFHDTHHRAVTAPREMARFDLQDYDGVLAFGEVIRRIYLDQGWTARAFTWHEAADTHVFGPRPRPEQRDDLVWVGNWGDDERARELDEFVLAPARSLRLSGAVHGVRYPWRARLRIRRSGLRYRGWVANYAVPALFSRHRVTVHVPRRPYVRALPGIPTIRVFEALACGIPLVCSPWDDAEELFTPGEDYLVAATGAEMTRAISSLLHDPERAAQLARHGLATVRQRHTCAHRVDELLAIDASLRSTELRSPA